jgi:succinate dehydrogenase hydrophobic anchor subunit
MKGNFLSKVILVFLTAALLYLLYYWTGGDWSAWLDEGADRGGANLLEMVTGSLSALAKGIGELFSGFFR